MSNIPKLRFPEFRGEWEEKKLDSLSLINPKPGDLPEVFYKTILSQEISLTMRTELLEIYIMVMF